jgi:hypothetical protein
LGGDGMWMKCIVYGRRRRDEGIGEGKRESRI